MKYRKLRIAWSVAWGIVAVLLCALWVRSYWWRDSVGHTVGGECDTCLFTEPGTIVYEVNYIVAPSESLWGTTSYSYAEIPFDREFAYSLWHWSQHSPEMDGLCIPIYAPIVVAGVFASVPWLRWQFSLRTLLIATTLVAVMLGLAVWLSR